MNISKHYCYLVIIYFVGGRKVNSKCQETSNCLQITSNPGTELKDNFA